MKWENKNMKEKVQTKRINEIAQFFFRCLTWKTHFFYLFVYFISFWFDVVTSFIFSIKISIFLHDYVLTYLSFTSHVKWQLQNRRTHYTHTSTRNHTNHQTRMFIKQNHWLHDDDDDDANTHTKKKTHITKSWTTMEGETKCKRWA